MPEEPKDVNQKAKPPDAARQRQEVLDALAVAEAAGAETLLQRLAAGVTDPAQLVVQITPTRKMQIPIIETLQRKRQAGSAAQARIAARLAERAPE